MKRFNGGLKWLCVLSILVILVPSTTLAQSAGTGALTGRVTDSTGAVIPNVTVTATGENGQVRTVTTGTDGSYKFPLLQPGNYRVKFEASGFKAVEVLTVTVTVTETGDLDRQLEIGAQTQEVTVEANVEAVQTTSSTVGTVINSKGVTELPLSTRNYTNLIALSAGANASVQNATAMGKGSQNIYTNGSSNSQNTFQMDGVSIANYGSTNTLVEQGTFGSIPVPSPDALQEFKIQTSTFDASYGRNPGANVNVVTKSGTNDFHGTAFEFFRNTSLNANDFFFKNTELAQGNANKAAVLNQNQYGGVIGGPVKKDKLFFFVSYQNTWQKNGFSLFGAEFGVTLPPLPSGDRSTAAWQAALGASICPQNNGNPDSLANTAAGTKAGTLVGTQVACDGSNINPVAMNILKVKLPNGSYYVPSSNLAPSTGIGGGYLTTAFSSPALYKEHQANGNFDYVIDSKNTLSGRYFYSIDPTTGPFAGGLNLVPLFVPGTPVSFFYANHAAVLKETSIITSNLVNEARVSFQRDDSIQTAQKVFSDAQFGITPLNPNYDFMSMIAINGMMTLGINNSALERYNINEYQVADQISWTHGKHSIRAGFEGDHYFWQFNFVGLQTGWFTFNDFADFLVGLPAVGNGTPNNGTAFSSVSAITTTAKTDPNGDLHDYLSHAFSSFVQDDYKITSRLTLNLGLRWEWDGYLSDKYGDITSVWPSLINTQPNPGSGCVYNGVAYGPGALGSGCSFAGYAAPANYLPGRRGPLPAGVFQNGGNPVQQTNPPWDNFAPRVGFAWQPLASNKLVLRGGFGYFYDYLDGGRIVAGYQQEVPYTVPIAATAGNQIPASSFANPFPNFPQGWLPRYANLTGSAIGNLQPFTTSNYNPGGGGGPISPTFTTPLVYQYDLNAQYEFLPSWVLELGYVGSHGIHQTLTNQINGAQLASAAAPVNGVVTGDTTANTSVRVPYLGFSPAFHEVSTFGAFKYNSLQATVRKQFSHGLTFQAAYTWSRAFILTDIGNPNDSFSFNVPVVREYGLNPQYHPQRLTVNYSYNLPFGNPSSALMNKLVTGWIVSGVTTIQDGTPLTITDNRGGSVFGTPITGNAQYAAGMGAANVGVSGSLYQKVAAGLLPGGTGYLNKAAFTTTPLASTLCAGCTGNLYGNSGISTLLGPGQNNWDISLTKMTKVGGLREDATLQFRAEFFNTFNHAQFNNPNNSTNGQVNFNSGVYGQISQSSVNPRLLQFALKYAF